MTLDTNENTSIDTTQKTDASQLRSKGRILLVDDEEMIRELFRRVLANAGYEVLVAGDGKQAMAFVEQERMDLVITDLVMPEQEGIETIRGLRSRYPDVKIIAISGAFDGSFLKVAKILGAQATLLKPVSPKDLLSAVRQVLA